MDKDQVQMLATYNSELARGLVHTKDWQKVMAELQAQYYRELQALGAVANG